MWQLGTRDTEMRVTDHMLKGPQTTRGGRQGCKVTGRGSMVVLGRTLNLSEAIDSSSPGCLGASQTWV